MLNLRGFKTPVSQINDESLTLSMTVSGLNDIKRWVLSYGKGARVLEPPQLISMVKLELGGMANYYAGDIS